MQLFGYEHHHKANPLDGASPAVVELYHMLARIINNQEKFQMATQAQIDKYTADVAALIAAGVAEITAAIATAQAASPDPAIDAADAKVTAATQAMTAAAAALTPPPAAPPAPTP
jgi:peptidoglycan hydrolase CwlO-like protein